VKEITIDQFVWDGFFWRASVELPVWRGFQSRGGSYGSRDSDDPSDGSVHVLLDRSEQGQAPLREQDLGLIRWAIAHASEMQAALLEGLLAEYPDLQEKYDDFAEPEDLPPVSSVDDFKSIIGLHTLHVHPIHHQGLPYIGFEFGCTWDAEHGLGVLMHGTRVVEIGGADSAILQWIAEQDAGIES